MHDDHSKRKHIGKILILHIGDLRPQSNLSVQLRTCVAIFVGKGALVVGLMEKGRRNEAEIIMFFDETNSFGVHELIEVFLRFLVGQNPTHTQNYLPKLEFRNELVLFYHILESQFKVLEDDSETLSGAEDILSFKSNTVNWKVIDQRVNEDHFYCVYNFYLSLLSIIDNQFFYIPLV